MLKKFLSGASAGVMISIGGAVFLACENKVVGAVFFCVALLSICLKGYNLYTGRIGFIPETHDKDALSGLFLGLCGNIVATGLIGWMLRLTMPKLGAAAEVVCTAKLVDQDVLSTLVRGIFCGVLMYIAVSVYKEKNTLVGVLFAIPTFILAGFEHSVADMFYFACSGLVKPAVFLFVFTVVVGNTLGAMLLPTLAGAWNGKKKTAAPAPGPGEADA